MKELIWTKDDSVNSHLRYEANSVKEFIGERFTYKLQAEVVHEQNPGGDTTWFDYDEFADPVVITERDPFDFAHKNSYWFSTILSSKFDIKIIWDDISKVFYSGVIGDNKAVLYNIVGQIIIEDPIRIMALSYFNYYDEVLYNKVKEFLD